MQTTSDSQAIGAVLRGDKGSYEACNSFRRKSKRETAFRQRLTVLESAETEPRADEPESLSEPLWESFSLPTRQ